MDASTVIWIIVIVAVLLIAAGVAFRLMGRGERRHEQAASLRAEAGERSVVVDKLEATATETAARSRAAQAEAEAKTAEAARLTASSQEHQMTASTARDDVDAQLAKADEVDPDVATDDQPDPDVATDHAAGYDAVGSDEGQDTDGPDLTRGR